MTLKERYINSPLEDLIAIIENEADYSSDCVVVVKEIVISRNLTAEVTLQTATNINKARIEKQLIAFNAFSDKLILLESAFFSPAEMKALYKAVIKKLQKRDEDMGIDVWSYAIGGL